MEVYAYQIVLFHCMFLLLIATAEYSNCSKVCNCSLQKFDSLGSRDFFVLNCSADAYDVANVSRADLYMYDSSRPMDTNFLQTFYNLKGLLVNRGIQSLSSLAPIASLRLLSVRSGNMAYIPALKLFSISAGLSSVSLTDCQIEFLSDEAFGKLDNLQHLNLSHNHLNQLPQGLFYSLRKLKTLDLSDNNLYSISSADLNGLIDLEWLNIGGNSMSSLEALHFAQQSAKILSEDNPYISFNWNRASDVRHLQLSSKKLVFLRSGSFSHSVIETFVLSKCTSLKLIEAEVFVNLTILELVITNNPTLHYIDPKALENIRKLHTLTLSYNHLHMLPETLLFITDLQTIVAVGNPLFCDCNFNWANTTQHPTVTVSSPAAPLSCSVEGQGMTCGPRLVYSTPATLTVDEGHLVHLRCKVSGLPLPIITWRYGGREIVNDSIIGISEGDLIIHPVTSANSGLYQCVALNTVSILYHNFSLSVTRDSSKIIIIKVGKTTNASAYTWVRVVVEDVVLWKDGIVISGSDMVELSWRVEKAQMKYKAILIDVRNNTETSYALKQYPRTRHSQSFTITGLQKSTTYRVCLAFENQYTADSNRCETITTLSSNPAKSSGVTDYSLYGIIIASIATIAFVAFIVCVCMASKRHVERRRKEDMTGMVSESSYGLMTTSFSQRSHLSSMYDNPGANVHTPTGLTPPGFPRAKLKRTLSDPLINHSVADTTL